MTTFTSERRQKLASKGQALPDGSYPIRNAADLANAIKAFGRAKNKARAKAWIIRRARDLKLTNQLPEEWLASQEALWVEASEPIGLSVWDANELAEVKSAAYPTLERVPGKQNWVDYAGGLPDYIERVAKHIHYEGGHPIGKAIAMAVGTMRRWCSGGTASVRGGVSGPSHVNADTKAKACKALAEWEAKKKAGGAAQKLAEALDPGVLAVGQALQEAAMLDLPDEYVSIKEAVRILEAVGAHGAHFPSSIHWDPSLHPRNRTGQFRDILNTLLNQSGGGEVTLPHGVSVRKRGGGKLEVVRGGEVVSRSANAGDAAKSALSTAGIQDEAWSFRGAFPEHQKTPNDEIVKKAMKGDLTPRRGKNLSVVPGKEPNTATVMTYKEPLAHIDHPSRQVHVSAHRYSPTSGQHRQMIETEAKARGYGVRHIDRAESRRRAGLEPDAPFEKLPAGVKVGSDEPVGEWFETGSKVGETPIYVLKHSGGRSESLFKRPGDSAWVHVKTTSRGNMSEINIVREEDAQKMISGKTMSATHLQGWGGHPTIPASEVKVGQHRAYNGGVSAPITKVETKGNTVHITTLEHGKEHTSKHRPGTHIPVSDKPLDDISQPKGGISPGAANARVARDMASVTDEDIRAAVQAGTQKQGGDSFEKAVVDDMAAGGWKVGGGEHVPAPPEKTQAELLDAAKPQFATRARAMSDDELASSLGNAKSSLASVGGRSEDTAWQSAIVKSLEDETDRRSGAPLVGKDMREMTDGELDAAHRKVLERYYGHVAARDTQGADAAATVSSAINQEKHRRSGGVPWDTWMEQAPTRDRLAQAKANTPPPPGAGKSLRDMTDAELEHALKATSDRLDAAEPGSPERRLADNALGYIASERATRAWNAAENARRGLPEPKPTTHFEPPPVGASPANPEWVDAAEAAKLVRVALKKEFPGTKFSVKTSKYSMGASISVHYEGGPDEKEVDALVSRYSGKDAPDVTDYSASLHHVLKTNPDGSHEIKLWTKDTQLGPDEKVVSLGSDYVSAHRKTPISEMETPGSSEALQLFKGLPGGAMERINNVDSRVSFEESAYAQANREFEDARAAAGPNPSAAAKVTLDELKKKRDLQAQKLTDYKNAKKLWHDWLNLPEQRANW